MRKRKAVGGRIEAQAGRTSCSRKRRPRDWFFGVRCHSARPPLLSLVVRRTLRMPLVECHHERVCDSPQGPVVAVSFRGVYPPGSLGNEHARQMCDYLAAVIAEAEPAAALLDLTALNYEWGDALAG